MYSVNIYFLTWHKSHINTKNYLVHCGNLFHLFELRICLFLPYFCYLMLYPFSTRYSFQHLLRHKCVGYNDCTCCRFRIKTSGLWSSYIIKTHEKEFLKALVDYTSIWLDYTFIIFYMTINFWKTVNNFFWFYYQTLHFAFSGAFYGIF